MKEWRGELDSVCFFSSPVRQEVVRDDRSGQVFGCARMMKETQRETERSVGER